MAQDSKEWEQLQDLFHLAEDVPESEVDAVLLEACGDPELRSRARDLITAERREALASVPKPTSAVGGRIGPYSVLRHLGSGGIGTVYLVERIAGGTVQRAALKVLSVHAAGPFFSDRFAREQHILASLDHPHITRMLDAGVGDAGEPYLVMEYVDGQHLDEYCDRQSLGLPERLRLFLQACEAVAYAHRNLIVHLDLKPSNILVTEAGGVVKLLDFGTSKLIQPDSQLTTTVMATPAYASPEQLLNEPVTTLCDVYALGAILFELLSGRRPNQDSSVAVMIERALKEMQPEAVTAAVTAAAAQHRSVTETRLRSLLTGDLATIVAKCLMPRPKDRYVTVEALIGDVQRYMDGRPILARAQTTTYRLGKFVRRNRAAVIGVSVMACCLLAVGVYAAWRQEQAFREGQRALQMQTFMSELFKLANTYYLGKPAATVPEFLQLGVKLIPDLIKDPADRRSAQLSLAKSMFDDNDLVPAQAVFADVMKEARKSGDTPRLAEAEAYAGKIAYRIGDANAAATFSADSLALAHRPGVTPSARVRILMYFVQNHVDRGIRTPEDEGLLRAAIAESRTGRLPQREQAWALGSLAYYLSATDKLGEAKSLANQALSIYAGEPYAFCDRAEMHGLLANIQSQSGDSPGSVPFYQAAFAESRSCSGDISENTLGVEVMMGRALLKSGRAPEAVPVLESSLSAWQKAYPASLDLVAPLVFLSRAYIQTSQFAKAESTAAEALQMQTGKVDPNSIRMAVVELLLAQAQQGQGRFAEALVHAEKANQEFAAIPSMSAAEKVTAGQAHTLMLDLQARH